MIILRQKEFVSWNQTIEAARNSGLSKEAQAKALGQAKKVRDFEAGKKKILHSITSGTLGTVSKGTQNIITNAGTKLKTTIDSASKAAKHLVGEGFNKVNGGLSGFLAGRNKASEKALRIASGAQHASPFTGIKTEVGKLVQRADIPSAVNQATKDAVNTGVRKVNVAVGKGTTRLNKTIEAGAGIPKSAPRRRR